MRAGRATREGAVALAMAAIVLGCHRAPSRTPGDATTTGGAFPNPAGVPPPSHTVDDSGWVDSAGRSANADARTEMSGMRPTEAGAQRVTGTPGSGLPLPIEPAEPAAVPEEITGEIAPGTERAAGTPLEAVVAALVDATCEREARCGRTGAGRRWRSGLACIEGMRPATGRALASAGCPYDFDVDAVAACAIALRSADCDASVEPASVPACDVRKLCVPL